MAFQCPEEECVKGGFDDRESAAGHALSSHGVSYFNDLEEIPEDPKQSPINDKERWESAVDEPDQDTGPELGGKGIEEQETKGPLRRLIGRFL